MRWILSIVIVAAAAGGLLFAQGGGEKPQSDTKIIDLMADVVYPIQVGDSTATALVGNFAAQHNGAVITCDSAVRYSDKHIEFFGNVLINKNTTYIYGDRADYNGELNRARVYSEIIKVVDGDATLYTYEFSFNTKENIGEFGQGGILINRENLMESVHGYYYADKKELVCVDKVEMRNDEYEMKSDSVIYNMATDHAYFFEHTNIWNKDGDYLYADRGLYNKTDTLYSATHNGYILTEKQELWSDSLNYYKAENHAVLFHDIQIDDTEHKVLAFGDFGEYWKEPGNAFLTRRPSMISYDAEQGDSLFMRADSMFLFTRNTKDDVAAPPVDTMAVTPADSLHQAGSAADSLGHSRPGASALDEGMAVVADSVAHAAGGVGEPAEMIDSLGAADAVDSLGRMAADSLARIAADTLSPAEKKMKLKEVAAKEKAARKKDEAVARKERLDKIADQRQEKTTAKLLAIKEREEARLAVRKLKAESKLKARQTRAARKGKVIPVDSTALHKIDSLLDDNALQQDSLARLLADSLTTDSLATVLPADSVDSLAIPRDSIYRLIKGYRDVRIYRSDFQTVCDSLVAISTDSTIHLYINPVLWNQNNQITSEVMDIYTANQQLVKADFVGRPMMVSELDTLRYNQVTGKAMTALFRDNQIYRNDVNGNAQTIYYMEDGNPPEVVMMGVVESGSITFYIEDKQVEGITYRGNPTYKFYPMDKIPADEPRFLKDFKWEGKRRPGQADVFDRKIRPSQREEKSQLPKPDFPIVKRVEEHKARLLALRRWVDRDDLVAPQAEEWMRSLGYPTGQPRE